DLARAGTEFEPRFRREREGLSTRGGRIGRGGLGRLVGARDGIGRRRLGHIDSNSCGRTFSMRWTHLMRAAPVAISPRRRRMRPIAGSGVHRASFVLDGEALEKRSRPSSAARPRSARLRPLGALEPAAPKSLEDARSPLGKSREMDGRPHRVESQAARPPGPARPPCHKGMTFLVDRELDSNPPMYFPPMARPI